MHMLGVGWARAAQRMFPNPCLIGMMMVAQHPHFFLEAIYRALETAAFAGLENVMMIPFLQSVS